MRNPLKEKLHSGQTILGIWSIISSPIVSEIFGMAGLDFQILDMEHGVFDIQVLDASIRACESTGCSPLVRVPGVIPNVIQSVMDLGAHGIIVPQVTDKKTTQAAIKCMKFAPEGVRGYNPFTRAALYSNPPSNECGKLNNQFGLSSIIIENVSAFESLDNILTIPDLDMVYLGVYDMSIALGCKGNVNHPDVTRFIDDSINRIRKAGKAAGLMVKSKEDMENAIKLGANVLVYSVDSFIIYHATSKFIEQFRETINQFTLRS